MHFQMLFKLLLVVTIEFVKGPKTVPVFLESRHIYYNVNFDITLLRLSADFFFFFFWFPDLIFLSLKHT